jgi:hypothetical protein
MSKFISQLQWRPAIGDPSFMGWLTVAAYAVGAILCFVASRHCSVANDVQLNRRQRRIWTGVALFMSFLCLNKQLDLQTLFTKIGRQIAIQGGWYDERRTAQLIFVITAAVAGIATFAVIARKTRFVQGDGKLLMFGLGFLLSFIVIRASSFHHVTDFLRLDVLGIRMNWVLELGGIALIALSAVQSIRRSSVG